MTHTWRGTRSMNAATASSGTEVEVGLLGLQTSTSLVATVTSPAIALRSWRSWSSSATSMAPAHPRRPPGGDKRRRRATVDDLGLRLEQRLPGREQDVA